MKFTSTPPTTPGFYAWKPGPDTDNKYITAEALTASSLEVAHKDGGLWCRLVPNEKDLNE